MAFRLIPILAFITFCIVPLAISTVLRDDFSENLSIYPIPQDGKVLFNFNFTMLSTIPNYRHTLFFPKRFLQLVHKHHIHDLVLSFTQGRWQYDKWNTDSFTNECIHPSGVELSVNFLDDVAELENGTKKVWKSLVHGLSGLFCASLNFMDLETHSYASGVVYRSNDQRQYYGTMSKETVCTENLTPFKSLLPATDGLVELLNPLKLYDCYYHSMTIKFKRVDAEKYWMSLGVVVVYDVANEKNQMEDVVLTDVFDTKVKYSRNPVAQKSQIAVRLSDWGLLEKIRFPEVAQNVMKADEMNNELVFDLPKDRSFVNSFAMRWKKKVNVLKYRDDQMPESMKMPITINKFHTYSDQVDGKISVHFENLLLHDSISVHYFDTIPWYFQIYTNSFSLYRSSNGNERQKFTNFTYIPLFDGKYVAIIFDIVVHPHETVNINFEVENKLLPNDEHPPDASRGFDLSSSVIHYSIGEKFDESQAVKYYTQSLLITLPIPDFSMPFNVLMITSTIISLFFGTFVNTLLKRHRWKLKIHLVKVLVEVGEDLEKEGKGRKYIRKNMNFVEDDKDVFKVILEKYFATEIVHRNETYDGKLLFDFYFRKKTGNFLLFLEKMLRKLIKFSELKRKDRHDFLVEKIEPLLLAEKGERLDKVKEKSKIKLLFSKLISRVTGIQKRRRFIKLSNDFVQKQYQ